MTFGEAIQGLKVGNRVSRASWNGKNISLMNPSSDAWMTEPYIFEDTNPGTPNSRPVPWTPSNADILAEDWYVPAILV